MFAKVEITGTLEVLTGMHIGGSSAFAAIGAVDSPIVRDTLSDMPMIPGSSLKGKLRTLLAQKYNESIYTPCDDDAPEILRLFGSAKPGAIKRSRLLFRDMALTNMKNFAVTVCIRQQRSSSRTASTVSVRSLIFVRSNARSAARNSHLISFMVCRTRLRQRLT